MPVDFSSSLTGRQVCDLQHQLIFVMELEYVLLFSDTPQDALVSELGVGIVASVSARGPLQVLVEFAM